MSGLTFQDNLFILHKRGDNTHNYQPARLDTASTVKYYGWLAADGSHILMKKDDTLANNIIIQYFYGDSSQAFATNWTNRAALTYVEYDKIL
jgi:hypothetical protein